MEPSQRLKLTDVRAVFRLIGTLREFGAEPDQWRRMLIGGLHRIIEADLIVSSEVYILRTATPGVLKVIDIGWGCDFDSAPWRIHSEREGDPETFLLHAQSSAALPESPGELVATIPSVKFRSGRSLVLSQYPLPHMGAVDQLGVHRTNCHHPFGPAEYKLIRLLHVELGRLWKLDAIKRAQDPTHDLPPRLQQTLHELLSGSAEKQIAMKLGLSRHTVHNYVKALHKRFDVSSRGELMAKLGNARDFYPKLSINVPQAE